MVEPLWRFVNILTVLGVPFGNLSRVASVVAFGLTTKLGATQTGIGICNLKYKNYGLEMVMEYRNKVL